MNQDIELYINGNKVDFDEKATNILFNYKETDLRNPTAVKNSFTKTVTLPGTKNNNDIFGHIWNLEKCQLGYGFNALRKTGFQLFYNGDKYEEGYCKLDSVKNKDGGLTYSCTLYGGIGDFIYNLTYLGDDTDVKKTLADLHFDNTQSLDFTINKEAIQTAWHTLKWGKPTIDDDRYEFINFAVTSNGLPSDFTTNKVLINTKNYSTSTFPQSASEGGTSYSTLNGWAMGEMNEDLTSDETFDLRSYLLTPVFNVKKIIEACCDPSNNGGYEVIIDGDGFSHNNPYYHNSWVTLKKLTDLEIQKGESETLTNLYLTSKSSTSYNINFDTPTLSTFNGAEIVVKLNFTTDEETRENTLFQHFAYTSDTDITLQKRFVKTYENTDGVVVQLLAYDAFGNIVGRSSEILCSMIKDFGFSSMPLRSGAVWYPSVFQKEDDHYTLVDLYTRSPKALKFTLPDNLKFDSLALAVSVPNGYKKKMTALGGTESYTSGGGSKDSSYRLWTTSQIQTTGNREISTIIQTYGRRGHFSAELLEGSISTTEYEGLFSNTVIPSSKLLATKNTPADYLLSYCKLFGLYIWQDPAEISSDEEIYPKGVIHINARKTFYKKDSIIDIQDSIDYNKEVTITPITAKSKWYNFDVEAIDGDASEKYKSTYSFPYGRQLINTGYNFDATTTNLYDGNAFKSAVMVQEKDKYFSQPSLDGVPVYTNNGFKYYLFHKDGSSEDYDTYEKEFDIKKMENVPINWENLDYYDCFEKAQLHSSDNEATDSENVLLFFDDFIDTRTPYWITDDIAEMAAINDGEACWIMTKSETDKMGHSAGAEVYSLPNFTRTLYGFESKYVVNSWDFGNPQATFVPEVYNTDEMGLYAKYWKTYIEDMYDQDSRIMVCYVRPDRRWGIQSMRDFYWFNNSIWRLNTITDYDISSSNSIKMEFIKVMDVANYDNMNASTEGVIKVFQDITVVPKTGGTVTGYIYSQGMDPWWASETGYIEWEDGETESFEPYDYMEPMTGSGAQKMPFSFIVEPNTTPRTRTITLGIEGYEMYPLDYITIFQEASTGGAIIPSVRHIETNASQQIQHIGFDTENIVGPVSGYVLKDEDGMINLVTVLNGVVDISLSYNSTRWTRTAVVVLRGTDATGDTQTAKITIEQESGLVY